MQLEGKQAIVTGGGSGIGAATCKMLAREGANVAILDINLETAEAIAKEVRRIGRRAFATKADVGSLPQVDAAMNKIRNEFGDVDILVNNAGIMRFTPFTEMTDELWNWAIAINLNGAFYCTHAVINGMIDKGRGRIVNISSVVGQVGTYNNTAYTAAKAGLIGFTKALAKEMALKGITVNAIAPGSIITSMYANAYSDPVLGQKLKQERLSFNMSRTPMGRQGTPDEVASAVVFLCSDGGGYFTGQVLSPNGGMYM